MKTLLLLRHSKAESHDARRDFERALAPRGKRDAPAAGLEMARRGGPPDVVASSPAMRARQTAEAAVDAAGWPTPITWVEEIYDATPAALLAVVRGLPADAAIALLVGHNPGLYELGAALVPGGMCDLPTTGLACLHLEVARWEDVAPGRGRLAWSWTPRGD